MADATHVTETVTFPGYHGDTISGYLARPTGEGRFPVVTLIHGINGLTPDVRSWTEGFARRGYVALGVDLYTRIGSGDPDDLAAVVRAQGGLPDAQALGDIEGSIRYLRSLPQSNGKAGIIGFCMGGRLVYLAACKLTGIDAAVDCWGGGVVATPDQLTETRPENPIDLTANLSCPLLGLFGEEDRNPSPAHVARMDEELKKHGKVYEFHSYAGMGHHYFANQTPEGRAATADSWRHVHAWFGKYLK